MRKQRVQTTHQAEKNQAALKAKLIDELNQIGGKIDEDEESEDRDPYGFEVNADGEKFYPPSYYSKQEDNQVEMF